MQVQFGNSLPGFITFLVFIISSYLSHSQTGIEPSRLKQFNITVNFEDYTVKTQMLTQNKNICADNERIYMWYTAQKIMETRGGFDGKLIHGMYRAFYLNSQLREQGIVKYGLRHKTWKYWYPDGQLREQICWKNGKKSGTYLLYNDKGALLAKSRFKNDLLHGSFYTYGNNGKTIEQKCYKNGEEVTKVGKRGRSWFGRQKEKKAPVVRKDLSQKRKYLKFPKWLNLKKSRSQERSSREPAKTIKA